MSENLTNKLPSADDDKLTQILTGVRSLDLRVANLERNVERRLSDTRPIWEKAIAEIAALNEGQRQLQAGHERLQDALVQLQGGQRQLQETVIQSQEGQKFLLGEVREVRTQLRDFSRKFSIFNDTLTQIQADYRDIYDRVRELKLSRS
jgi:predicted nuclease with TOPRIM domain